ncbi:MAG: hypothetical protein Q4D96_06615 [Propionibacteriaceae bacterium]|nr:hypothetical protein [Propionibacteriaceae bacterium]
MKQLEAAAGGPLPNLAAIASMAIVATVDRGTPLPGGNQPMMWWVWEGTLSAQFDLGERTHIARYLEAGDIFISTFPKELGELLGLSTAHPIYDSPLVRARKRGVALERSQLVGVSLGLITDFARKHANWQALLNISVLRLMTFHMNREYQFLTMNAEQRYLAFLKEFPRASSLVSQREAANYLGLTAVGLNRVVARLRREGRHP